MSLTIKVTVSAGTDIANAIREAQEIRSRTGAAIEFEFNGIEVLICRDDQRVDDLVAKYHKAIKKPESVLRFVA